MPPRDVVIEPLRPEPRPVDLAPPNPPAPFAAPARSAPPPPLVAVALPPPMSARASCTASADPPPPAPLLPLAAAPTTKGAAAAPATAATEPAAETMLNVIVQGKTDRDAEFVAFVERDGTTLHRVAYLLAGDAYRAEELLQSTLERTYRSWAKARQGDPLAYARRVLANLRIDTWRRTRRAVILGADAIEARTGPVADRSRELAARDELVRALRALPVKQRRVVVLRYLADLTEAEVAAELGLPLGTVKSTASRALDKLRAVLAPAVPTLAEPVTAPATPSAPVPGAASASPSPTIRRDPHDDFA